MAVDIRRDALEVGFAIAEAEQYAQDVVTFLALALDRCADFNNALARWNASNQKVMNLFGRQALPMVWDFAEANTLGEAVGAWLTCSEYAADCIRIVPGKTMRPGFAHQQDAAAENTLDLKDVLVSTDPPYYNNIGYAALSDFFYAWLRRTVGGSYRDLFGTMWVPKVAELTAVPDRFEGSRSRAKEHFESGFKNAFTSLRQKLDPRFPLTVYYAFKQEDEEGDEPDLEEGTETLDLTTGWETLLEALIGSGFQITATLPVRASQKWRMVSMGTNALASYIVLACRPRALDAPQSARREFIAELRKELPVALRHLQQGNVAPVDFAQAAIGPGMAVYSRYSRILESSTGQAMSVRAALGLINQVKDEVLGEAEADYDPYTRWAIAWYDQHGFEVGEFGDANTLANAHAVAVNALRDAGLVKSGEGEVRLLKPEELDKDWEPEDETRRSIWQMTHQLVRRYFVDKVGDMETAVLLSQLGPAGESARDLAYRLFSIAERRKRSQDAQGYNALVLGWPEIARLAQSAPSTTSQAELL
jgi:putative DNA methylase